MIKIKVMQYDCGRKADGALRARMENRTDGPWHISSPKSGQFSEVR